MFIIFVIVSEWSFRYDYSIFWFPVKQFLIYFTRKSSNFYHSMISWILIKQLSINSLFWLWFPWSYSFDFQEGFCFDPILLKPLGIILPKYVIIFGRNGFLYAVFWFRDLIEKFPAHNLDFSGFPLLIRFIIVTELLWY